LGGRQETYLEFSFDCRQSAIIAQSRNPPLGDVSCRHCGEDDETPIHIICDCGHFVEHKLDTIGVHPMSEDNPEGVIDSIIKFLLKEEIPSGTDLTRQPTL
jgi:hypothetical protein